jgi:nucleoside-diphosphate-sugar epimerase
MTRKRYILFQAGVDFAAFNIVSWASAIAFPNIGDVYGEGLLSRIWPLLISAIMVILLAVFRQYRIRQRDRFWRQSMGAFNAVTLGFLIIVIISFDLGVMLTSQRGHLFFLLLGLLIATALSRVITYLSMGRRPDFSLKEPMVLKNGNGSHHPKSAPLVLAGNLSLEELKRQIDSSPYDFAVLTDESGYFAGTITDSRIIESLLHKQNGASVASDIIDREYPVVRENTFSAGRLRQMMIDRNLRFVPILSNEGKPQRVVLLSDLDEKYHSRPLSGTPRHVLVIGGAGFIGSVMVRYLLKRGYHVSVLDNLMYGYDALKELDNHPAYRFHEGDARNIQDLLTAMENVDTVVHLAAIVGDPACELDHRATIDINYEASKILVEACLHKRVERLLFASTCSVYGAAKNGELLTEDSPLNPVSLYAETKLRSEEAILSKAAPPLAVTIFRLATVFGFSYRPRFDLVVNTLTARALEDGEISIFGGSQWRPNVHVLDVVSAFAAAMETPKEEVDRKIFNLGSERENYRISELGDLVRQALPETKVKVVDAAIDPRDYRVGFDRIQTLLRWEAHHSVSDGIREIIDAYRQEKFGHYTDKIYSNLKHLQ